MVIVSSRPLGFSVSSVGGRINEDALPLIVTHGWPGSIIEQLKIIEPLTNPTAHGASAADAFNLVIPPLPGYGFSAKPAATGWDPARTARAWVVLMTAACPCWPPSPASGGLRRSRCAAVRAPNT